MAMNEAAGGVLRAAARTAVVVLFCCAAAAAMAVGVTTTPNAIPVVLVNPDFEAKPVDSVPAEGWASSVHATANAYAFELDKDVRHAGKASMRIRRTGSEPWGMIHQSLPAAGLNGRTLEFSAWLRTDHVEDEGAALVLRTLANGAVDKVMFMSPAVTGSRDWKRYTIRFVMPRVASVVEVGVMLQGGGTLWVDDAALVVLP
jgi:hypothetical protein